MNKEKENYNEFTIVDVLDEFIKYESKIIQNSINDEKFVDSIFFKSMYIYYGCNYENGNSFKELKGKFGIYFFYMTDNINLSYKNILDFNECASGGKFKKYKSINLNIGDCLYLGSSTSNSLYTRLNQHFDNKDDPAALHLSLDKRKVLKDKVKIYAFPVSDNEIKNIDMLLKGIEKELHNIYVPLAGNDRT